jgi:hypothetical protein
MSAAALAPHDAARLTQLEVTIERGLTTFVEVGAALAEIRDSRLYREAHGTFEDYCHQRWQMERRHAYRLMDAATVVANVSNWTHDEAPPPTVPATESQARPLAKLEPEQQRAAWKEAVETAPEGKVTAAHVAASVQRITQPEPLPQANAPAPSTPAPTTTDPRELAKDFSREWRESLEGQMSAYSNALPNIPAGDIAQMNPSPAALEKFRMHVAFMQSVLSHHTVRRGLHAVS